MDILGLIHKKRGGNELTAADIGGWVEAVVDGGAPDYQSAALLMAICYEGLSYNETLELTRAFVNSGETLCWEGFDKPVVDKHSTGGVGDSVSLLLLPWLAAEGFLVPKMSGRGLGHTGGTIDKLESIPGFRTDLSTAEMRKVLEDVGCCIVSQTANLVPADKKLYALRDITGTVDEMGLIAASVVSKKIAAGAQYIVLDVKCGNGAFFKTHARAKEFAEVAIRMGKEFDRKIGCVITDMNQPLGMAVGNAIEVNNVRMLLADQAYFANAELATVAHTLRNVLLVLSGRCASLDEAMQMPTDLEEVKASFRQWIEAQGGLYLQFGKEQMKLAEQTVAGTPGSQYRQVVVKAQGGSCIHAMDTMAIGELARSLGAGRRKLDDVIDPSVGMIINAKVGYDWGEDGEVAVIDVKKNEARTDEEIAQAYVDTLTLKPEPCDPIDPILEVVL